MITKSVGTKATPYDEVARAPNIDQRSAEVRATFEVGRLSDLRAFCFTQLTCEYVSAWYL